jgi:hypothetical protein
MFIDLYLSKFNFYRTWSPRTGRTIRTFSRILRIPRSIRKNIWKLWTWFNSCEKDCGFSGSTIHPSLLVDILILSTAITERTIEVCHGECPVCCCEIARRAMVGRRACFWRCLFEMQVLRRSSASLKMSPNTSWTSMFLNRRGRAKTADWPARRS